MINGLSTTAILQRDGTGQTQRQVPELNPDFIPIEERGITDWIAFAKQYAKELNFFNEDNLPNNTWEGFLSDINTSDLLTYIENPDAFPGDAEAVKKLSRPHLVLFISFLQLLGFIKDQINEFTKKHLDFYYYDILGLTPKGPVPDEANVIVQLVDDVKEYFVQKGTQLLAGQDSEGKDLIYVTEWDTVINQAQVQNIKTFYTGKKTTTLLQVKGDKDNVDDRLIKMMQLALGDPNPGDPLPYHNSKTVGIAELKAINSNLSDPNNQFYVENKLFFTEKEGFPFPINKDNFAFIINNYAAPAADWERIAYPLKVAYNLKLLAQSANNTPGSAPSTADNTSPQQEIVLIEPVLEEWGIAYATSDARASAFTSGSSGDTTLYFNTFGKGHTPNEIAAARPVSIGLAITSPQLLLQEGNRTITISLSFENSGLIDSLPADPIFPSDNNPSFPFSFYLSTGKDWLQVKGSAIKDSVTIQRATLQYINQVAGDTGETYVATLNNDNIIQKSSGTDFSYTDIGKYFVLNNGMIYRIVDFIDKNSVKVEGKGKVNNQSAATKKYNRGEVYTAGMQITLSLIETDPPLLAPVVPNETMSVQSDYPVIGIILNQRIPDAKPSYYQLFKNLQLQKIRVDVKAEGLKTLTLQNDDATLNYKKPFEPFGLRPETGSHFYFAHTEICSKPLDTLTLHFGWMNVPSANLYTYYKDYNNTLIVNNGSFTADLKCMDENIEIDINKNISLFNSNPDPKDPHSDAGDASKPHTITTMASGLPLQFTTEESEVINWKRYFSLELNAPDFQHNAYPELLTKVAYGNSREIIAPSDNGKPKITLLNPPYTPKLKSFTVDYTASFEINISTYTTTQEDNIFHVNVFGYAPDIQTTVIKDGQDNITEIIKWMDFLPQFENEGELYIGIINLAPPQNLSVFFQLAEGSADPDLDMPPINWSYLSNNSWQPLQGTNLVFDSTSGLLNTGIIELAIPADANSNNTLLGQNLYWLRASIAANADAIPDTVDIFTQGISAVFTDNENAPEHYLNLLAPSSIKDTVAVIPEIKKIIQPYSSSKGKPAEEDSRFYIRVSERLRHKGRALTMWDYEHLVLEQFPEIYKVKCVPADDIGATDIIVIPDIKGKLPFNPFEPKAPSNVIDNIQQYLEVRVPAWATVKVKNPSYIQVQVRIAVKIREGYSESFFVAKLEEELIRYLAPWAYDEGADIFIDRRLDADVIVNFVAERFYVEFASNIELFTVVDNEPKQIQPDDNGEYYVLATNPGDILVSAREHVIDVIRKEYKQNNYQGIGYMKVELDFRIG
jgi:hypothetical protein